MLTFATERYADVMPDAAFLAKEHCAETEHLPYDPDLEGYRQLDASGVLHITTARADGQLVGYVLALLAPSLHHRGLTQGVFYATYLDPLYRRGTAGLRLIAEAERALRAKGVGRVFAGCKTAHDLSSLFARLGWTQTEIYFEKVF